ncbi:hypothetical protein ACM44_13430 [Chryseobacterium koreense CCUG 49689]|uniref:Uncharacterized protein n=2 Tax=Chryseobacterium koreense TaxID=232216 RepID=A0A0J7IWS1_9FLAO|nr:hypothetical protein ACM44_13430 [Chryseobacterium koreense CCUG 49689]
MKIFDLNLKKYALLATPPFLRGTIFMSFINSFIDPLDVLYITFLKNRKQNLIKMNHNFQKFSMQKRLNDVFDQIERRIKIVNAVQYEGVFIYTEAETDPTKPGYYSTDLSNKMKWLFGNEKPIYLRNESELSSDYDFIVEIPDAGINQMQMKAEIDFYVLPSKSYLIIIK